MRQSLSYILIPLRHRNTIVYTKVDREDINKVLKYTWFYSHGYARAEIDNKKTISLHRLVFGATDDYEVDHINRNKLDNRRGNLRLATRSQNNINSIRPAGSRPYRGVYQRSQNSFRAVCHANGKTYKKGGLRSWKEGAIAYNKLACKYQGKFAVLNRI